MSRSATLAVLATLASAALIRLAFPPFDLGPLILVGWVPLLWAVRRVGVRPALLLGLGHGCVLGLAAHPWIVGAITSHSELAGWQAVLALAAISALCGLRSALVVAAVAFGVRRGLPLVLAFPIFTACAELLVPGFFPWTNALAAHSIPSWSQAAAWGGATLVSAWLSATNALVTVALERWQRERRLRLAAEPVAAAAGLALLATLLGAWAVRAETARAAAAPRVRLALVHAVSSGSQQPELVPALRALTLAHERDHGPADLVLWPEGVSPLPVPRALLSETARRYWLRDRLQPPSAPQLQSRLLLGVSLETADGLSNSAVLIDRGGRVAGVYSKRHLVPLGETGLLPEGWSSGALGEGVTSYRPGSEDAPLELDGHALAASICFEDIFSQAVRDEVARVDAELLVNLSSDRWFSGTSAVDFHLALAKLRAVEHRKYLARVSLDGVSALVDSAGRVVTEARGAPSRVIEVEAALLPGLTPYARWAPIERVVWLLAGALLLASAARRPLSGTR